MPNLGFIKSHHSILSHYHIHISESTSLYLTHTLRTLSLSLIGIFIPLYIYDLTGKPMIIDDFVFNSIIWVIMYYIIRSISIIVLTPLFTHVIFEKLHFKYSIFVSSFVLAIAIYSLNLLESNFYLMYISAILIGIQIMMYWIPYHILFIRKAKSKDGHYGKKFGTRIFLTKLASAAGPFIGGLILLYFNFNILFLIGSVLITISSLPMLFSVHEHKHRKHNAIKIFLKYIKNPKYKNETVAISGVAIEDIIYGIFWPIILLITFLSFAKVGAITSISLLISSILALKIGSLIDSKGPKKIHKIGVSINSLLYIPRIFSTSTLALYSIDIMDKMNSSLYVIPFTSVMYEHARKGKHDSEFIIYREMLVHIIFVITLFIAILLIILLLNVGLNIRLIFLIPAFAGLLSYRIHRTRIGNEEN